MDIKHLDNLNVLLGDTYKVTVDEYKKFKKLKLIDMIEKFAEYKQIFISVKGVLNKSQTQILSSLLEFEIAAEKDLIEHSYDEIIAILRTLSEHNAFTSKSRYNAYLNIIYHYTVWGYNSHLRADIVTIQDMTKALNTSEAIDSKMIEYKTLTWEEMKAKASNVSFAVVEIYLNALMEGIKPEIILDIKLDQFYTIENHPIHTEKGTINVSDVLYEKMYDFSILDAIEVKGARGIMVTKKLVDSGYLLRPTIKTGQPIGRMKKSSMAQVVRKCFDEVGYEGDPRDFRSSAILNDILDGMDVHQINEKYDLNYVTLESMGNKDRLEILKKKRQQGNNKLGE